MPDQIEKDLGETEEEETDTTEDMEEEEVEAHSDSGTSKSYCLLVYKG